MASSKATTVSAYLAELPPDRRAELRTVRDTVKANLPKGYVEEMSFGMINYCVPLSRFPNTYNKLPLCYVALAAQKDYNSLYLMTAYGDVATLAKLKAAFVAEGKKLDMGKSCVRFQKASDLPLGAIGEIVAAVPAERWIEIYEASRVRTAKGSFRER